MVLTLGLQSTLKDNSKQEPTEWSKNALEKQNQESEDLGEASGKNYTPPPKKNWKKTGKKPSFAACHFSISPPPIVFISSPNSQTVWALNQFASFLVPPYASRGWSARRNRLPQCCCACLSLASAKANKSMWPQQQVHAFFPEGLYVGNRCNEWQGDKLLPWNCREVGATGHCKVVSRLLKSS